MVESIQIELIKIRCLGGKEMLKVVIADDEEHICRLIHALVDWEALQMEVMGFAANGLEAIELIEKWKPDLLITDIRMPGCDGIELIKRVNALNPMIEIIIISGHAEFSYAQAAMRYSVGNYLLKPINKTELNQTLIKLGDKIRERQNSESGMQKLIEQTQNSRQQMRNNLMMHLQDGTIVEPTEAMLREGCGLELKGEAHQVFCLKIDFQNRIVDETALSLGHEKAHGIIKANLGTKCTEIVVNEKGTYAYGILFFDYKKSEDIRRIMRDCLNQLLMQKSILASMTFTIAMGEVEREIKYLATSVKQIDELIQERLVTSTERLIEASQREHGVINEKALERYIRRALQAIQMYSQQEAALAVEELEQEVMSVSHPSGREVMELVLSAGATLLMQVDYKKQKEVNEKFCEQCSICGESHGLFETLLELEQNIIEEMAKERDNDSLRPIRLAKQYIRNHYNEQITLEEVSDVVGLSSSYFSALFKKEIGEGFAKYLISIRMEESKRLLRESNMSISVICKTVGYNDTKHFTNTFEKATGLKPSAYRKLYG